MELFLLLMFANDMTYLKVVIVFFVEIIPLPFIGMDVARSNLNIDTVSIRENIYIETMIDWVRIFNDYSKLYIF